MAIRFRSLYVALACLCSSIALAESSTIYRCELDGVLTFSDRPCGPTQEQHESNEYVMNTYEPAKTQSGSRSDRPRPPAKRPAARDIGPDQQKETCARIERSLQDIRSKMRAGYSAGEGERLKARQNKLREQRRQEKCS